MIQSDEPRAKTVDDYRHHHTAVALVFGLAMCMWVVVGTLVGTGHIDPLVATLATVWFAACVATGLLLPPRHARPLSDYKTSEAHTPVVGNEPAALFVTQVSPVCTPRLIYGVLSFLQTQCAMFVMGSLVYGVSLMSSGTPSTATDKGVISGILVIASIIGALGWFWPTGIEKIVILAQTLSLFVPIAATRDAQMILHVDTTLAVGMIVIALLTGWIIGRDYYVRALCLVSFAAAGALVCITSSWEAVVDPASDGPYVLVCTNLAIWVVISLLMTSRTRRITVIAILALGIALSLVVSLVLDTRHPSMPTWAATLVLALIFLVWVAVYDMVQYSVLLAAHIGAQDHAYKNSASGHYLIAVLMINRYTTWS
jgi:hypothetical protein